MPISSSQIIELNLVQNMIDQKHQVQQCGIDFTLKKVAIWTSSGSLDFDNSKRVLADTKVLEFDNNDKVVLPKGTYLVEFNETVTMPNDIMASSHSRSSLFRLGATFTAGVIDPGYTGAVGGLLNVLNENGITLYKNAKIAQWVFERLDQPSDNPYSGKYQGAGEVV